MVDISRVFNDIYDISSRESRRAVKRHDVSLSQKIDSSEGEIISGPQREYRLQDTIRPLFGKDGINDNQIGTHPDFLTLEGESGDIQKHYVCTLFVDIRGSTRLSLLYELEQVFLFKNAVLKTCIEVVRSLDGYVHRLMGDAVMAFFGGKSTEKEQAICDAINCCVVLRAILEGSIKPWMEAQGMDAKDFGFRVGCEFGDDEKVLWGSFGYASVSEVSATGLPVDMASKLQSLAKKNQTMLGQDIISYVNWPNEYTEVKQVERNGRKESVPVVTPNLTDASGVPINYEMRLLPYSKVMRISALPRKFRQTVIGSSVIDHGLVDYSCYVLSGEYRVRYISASRYLEKELSLEFEVITNTHGRLKFPLTARFFKINYGPETPVEERGIEQPPREEVIRKNPAGGYGTGPENYTRVTIDEITRYRGLHTMKCEVTDKDARLIFRDWIGVMIK